MHIARNVLHPEAAALSGAEAKQLDRNVGIGHMDVAHPAVDVEELHVRYVHPVGVVYLLVVWQVHLVVHVPQRNALHVHGEHFAARLMLLVAGVVVDDIL